MKNWMIAVAVVLGLGLVLFLSDRPVKTPSGLDLIRDANQYQDAQNKASGFALTVFQKANAGEEITEDDKVKLREALKYFDAMTIFEPRHVTSYFGAGYCHMLLGEKEQAAESFEQSILNIQTDPLRDQQTIRLTVFEAMSLLSETTLDLGAQEIGNFNSLAQANDLKGAEEAKKRAQIYYDKSYKYANAAIESKPDAFRYWLARANVLLALKREEEARKDVLQAFKLAPTDPRVQMMVRMLKLKI
jgi:tetratricopeptide (TPR) repeat protein